MTGYQPRPFAVAAERAMGLILTDLMRMAASERSLRPAELPTMTPEVYRQILPSSAK
jgi:hypothetical protein